MHRAKKVDYFQGSRSRICDENELWCETCDEDVLGIRKKNEISRVINCEVDEAILREKSSNCFLNDLFPSSSLFYDTAVRKLMNK